MGQLLKQRDIILVPFPFTDLTNSKRRPALIISNNKFNKESGDVIVCAITSNISDDSILIQPDDWKSGRYSKSCIKYKSIITLDKRIVIKRIGRLRVERFNQVIEKIHKIIF